MLYLCAVRAYKSRLNRVNLSILYQFYYFRQFFALVLELLRKVGEGQAAQLRNVGRTGWAFVDLKDEAEEFGFHESVVGGCLLLEMCVFLYFFVKGLEKFQDSCRDSAHEGFLLFCELTLVDGKELERFLFEL